jgi:hypothetical protein
MISSRGVRWFFPRHKHCLTTKQHQDKSLTTLAVSYTLGFSPTRVYGVHCDLPSVQVEAVHVKQLGIPLVHPHQHLHVGAETAGYIAMAPA